MPGVHDVGLGTRRPWHLSNDRDSNETVFRVHQAERFSRVNTHCESKVIRMAEGTVKRITDRGFGFIATDDATDMFFHCSNVDGQFESLQEGQRVSYDVGTGPKGPRAENVRSI